MSEQKIIIFSKRKTNRQLFIFQLIFTDLLGLNFTVVCNETEFENFSGPKLSYSDQAIGDEFFIASSNLLFERGIQSQEFGFSTYLNLPCFFETYNRKSKYRFDLLAASFYLVTRYEEYLPFIKDRFGRFSATESIAFQHHFLNKPLVNIWALDLGKKLKTAFPELEITNTEYHFYPTIDIDAAYSFKEKGFLRTIGGYIKNFRDKNYREAIIRTNVIRGKVQDPFDTFDKLIELHQKHELEAIYFILFAIYNEFDKNIPRTNRTFQSLIRKLADYSYVGIHPSFSSNEHNAYLSEEVNLLSEVVHNEITKSRQHFLKLHLPRTYHELINIGIKEDYTMGYSDQIGFRASICTPYFFYDLENEQQSSLKIFPFAVMDGTLRDYLSLEIDESYSRVCQLIDEVKNVNGTFISLWHNESMSNQKRWIGWDSLYEKIILYAK